MYNPISKEILSLMNKHLILPWANKHSCKQSFGFLGSENLNNPTETSTKLCPSCEENILWLNLAKELLIYITPKQEIELPETQFSLLVDIHTPHNNKNLQVNSNNLFNHTLSVDSKTNKLSETSQNEEPNNNENILLNEYNTEVAGVWVTSQGTYYFKLNSLHIHLQLFYSFLKHLNQIFDIDALHNLLICLRVLILQGTCLETAAKDQKGFLIYCLEKYLVPK
jgi:hypothetical protein